MIRNYFLLFFRNLKRQKLFSIINMLGLTVSIVSTTLIYLYVREELSFDKFHHQSENIYRVNQTFIWGDNTNNQFASTGPGVATALQTELPEIKMLTSIWTPGSFIVSYVKPNQEVVTFEEEKILAADTNFFNMFNFPLVAGDAATALTQAGTMVLTEAAAKRYFGTEKAVGKMLRLGGLAAGSEQRTYEITAVVKQLPTNSYIDFDFLLSMNSFPVVKKLYWSWIWTQLETYVLLDPRASIEDVRAKLSSIPRKYAEETLQRTMNTSFDEYTKSGKKWELFLQPMTSIHLPNEVVLNRIGDSGNIKIVGSLIAGAIFIILLSCVNFMNLSTAQFTRRIKEASIRKILGLGRKDLSIGYFAEALLFCGMSLVVALVAAQALLPGFNYITGKSLQLNILADPGLLIAMVALIVGMAALSSSYPSLFLSGFNPVEAIRGKSRSGKEGKSFRNSLVVFQFSISLILIICTAIVFNQLNFASQMNLGFDKENLVVLKHVEGLRGAESFTNSIRNVTGVEQASWCTSVPPSVYGGDKFTADGMNGQTFSLNYTTADDKFLPTLDIKLKYGRNFSVKIPGDENRVIINEATVRKIGWPMDESLIGRKIKYPGGNDTYFEVAGVVSDFNYWSLAVPIEPMAIFYISNKIVAPGQGANEFAVVRLAAQNGKSWESTIDQMTQIWKQHADGAPFQYEFVDMAFAQTFKTQQQFGSVLTIMAILAILIAALGLLGMIIYSLEQRSKEIGIRKVSGASIFNILTLISKGYAKLILIAFILGAPVSWYVMDMWLRDFAYKVHPSPLIYVSAGLGLLILAGVITSYHSIKAAMMNPVQVLRDE